MSWSWNLATTLGGSQGVRESHMQVLQSAVPAGSTIELVSKVPSWMTQPWRQSDSNFRRGSCGEEPQLLLEIEKRIMKQDYGSLVWSTWLVCLMHLYAHWATARNPHGQQRIPASHHSPSVVVTVHFLFCRSHHHRRRDRRDIALPVAQSPDFWHCLWLRGRCKVSTTLIIRLIVCLVFGC